ncbi:hypothetical protein GN956_G20819 [Arapaima gigas]
MISCLTHRACGCVKSEGHCGTFQLSALLSTDDPRRHHEQAGRQKHGATSRSLALRALGMFCALSLRSAKGMRPQDSKGVTLFLKAIRGDHQEANSGAHTPTPSTHPEASEPQPGLHS